MPEKLSGVIRVNVAPDAAHQRGAVATQKLFGPSVVLQELMTVKGAKSLVMTMKTNSRTAKGLAICEAARTVTETSLKLNRVEQVISNDEPGDPYR